MAQAEGWIDAYEALEQGRAVPPSLATVLSNRNGLGETMLHWYAIEGSVPVVEKMIALGFDVDTTNHYGSTPLCECAQLGKWEMVELLLARGARTDIRDCNGEDVFAFLEDNDEHENLRILRELVAWIGTMENPG